MGTRLANRKLRWLYRLSLTRTARVAMVGKQVHDHFVKSGLVLESNATTVLNGIPVDRFRNSPERRAAARHSLGLDLDTPVIGCVGRLVALKNHAVLLAAFQELLPSFPTLQLVLVGDGPLANELRALAIELGIADRVRFLGAHPAVADLLPAFDVFALPSKTEGLSIALLEACATGLAVVATAVGGNPDIIADGKTGLLVAVDDKEALAAALNGLLSSPSERARLGTAASQWVETHASAESLRIAYDAFYGSARSTYPRLASVR
jgi:glycosyltransferase involved in cell wall biosynthesis